MVLTHQTVFMASIEIPLKIVHQRCSKILSALPLWICNDYRDVNEITGIILYLDDSNYCQLGQPLSASHLFTVIHVFFNWNPFHSFCLMCLLTQMFVLYFHVLLAWPLFSCAISMKMTKQDKTFSLRKIIHSSSLEKSHKVTIWIYWG